jgi:hypothetical protein
MYSGESKDLSKQWYFLTAPWPASIGGAETHIHANLTFVGKNNGRVYRLDLSSSHTGPAPKATYQYAVKICHTNAVIQRFYLTGFESCSKSGLQIPEPTTISYVQLQWLS